VDCLVDSARIRYDKTLISFSQSLLLFSKLICLTIKNN